MHEAEEQALIRRFEHMLQEDVVGFFDVEEFEHIATYYLETGDFTKALKAIDFGSHQHPYAPSFVVKRAQYAVATDRLDEAEQFLNHAESLDPTNADVHATRGLLFAKQGRPEEAIRCLKKAIRTAEDPVGIWIQLGGLYQSLGRYEEAIKFFKQVLDEEPSDENTLYNLAICYDSMDQGHKAVEWFHAFIQKHPYSETAWYHLGITYSRLRNPEEALKSLDYALLIDDQFTAAYYEKARLLERSERFAEAAAVYKQSLEGDEESGYAHFRLGNCLRMMEQLEGANEHFRKAIELDPELDEAHLELALMLSDQGRFFESLHHIKKALSLESENPDYHLVAADIYKRMGLLQEAENRYRTVLYTLQMADPDLYMDYAELLLDMEQVDLAYDTLLEALLAFPDSEALHAVYAGYLLSSNDWDEALAWLERGLLLNPAEMGALLLEYFPHLRDDARLMEKLGPYAPPLA
jgi:tetratricopeptide (TPR) repeat protein